MHDETILEHGSDLLMKGMEQSSPGMVVKWNAESGNAWLIGCKVEEGVGIKQNRLLQGAGRSIQERNLRMCC